MNQDKKEGKKGADACELTRTCCVDTRLDKICVRNDADTSMGNIFNWKDLQLTNVYESRIWHYHSSYFMSPNPDGFDGKASIGRIQYGGYGLIMQGIGLNSGGGTSRIVWTPTKLQYVGDTSSGFISYYEGEITFDRWNIIHKLSVEPKANGQLPLSIGQVNGGHGAVYRTDIDGQYCGFEERITAPANVYDSALDKTFLIVFDRCPDSYDTATRKMLYNAVTGQTYDFMIVVTDKSHESGVSEWMQNYYSKEQDLRTEYESFAREIKHPSELGITNPADKFSYYLNDYSNWFDRIRSHDEDTTSNLKDKEVWVPSSGGYPTAVWKWDSFWSAFSTLGVLKDFNGVRNQALADQIDVWKQNTAQYPSIDNWPLTIYNHVLSSGDQNEGGWALAIWDYYKKTGNKALLCGIEPNLRSEYEYQKSGRGTDWRAPVKQLGRDGSDVSANSEVGGLGDTVDSTAWFMIDSLVMANIEQECGNQIVAEQYFSEFESIKHDSKAFWDSQVNFYVSFGRDGNFHYFNGDINSFSSTPNACLFLAMDAVDEANIQPMVDTLFNKFVDVVGLTSAPKTHQCYTSKGSQDNGPCWAGETWDGPTWAGPDNTLCTWALRQQVNVYGRTYLQDELDRLEAITLQVAKQHPFGAESYNSDGTSNPAVWSGRPYGWGALVGTNPVSDYNPISTLQVNSESCSYETCGNNMCLCGETAISCPNDCLSTEIACLGDSITAGNNGYCYKMRDNYVQITQSWGYGYSGRTSKEFITGCGIGSTIGCVDTMLANKGSAPAKYYTIVIVLIGTNDLYLYHDNDGQTTVDQYYSYLTQTVQKLKDNGLKVVLSTIPPCSNSNWQCANGDTTKQEERNRVVRRVADEQDVLYADIFNDVFDGAYSATQFADSVHPNEASHQLMSDLYMEVILSGATYDCNSNPGTCYTPSIYDYTYLTTSAATFIGGGSFNSFISSANNWVSS